MSSAIREEPSGSVFHQLPQNKSCTGTPDAIQPLWKLTLVGDRLGGNLRSVSAGLTRAAPGGSEEIERAERKVSVRSLALTKLRPWLTWHHLGTDCGLRFEKLLTSVTPSNRTTRPSACSATTVASATGGDVAAKSDSDLVQLHEEF